MYKYSKKFIIKLAITIKFITFYESKDIHKISADKSDSLISYYLLGNWVVL